MGNDTDYLQQLHYEAPGMLLEQSSHRLGYGRQTCQSYSLQSTSSFWSPLIWPAALPLSLVRVCCMQYVLALGLCGKQRLCGMGCTWCRGCTQHTRPALSEHCMWHPPWSSPACWIQDQSMGLSQIQHMVPVPKQPYLQHVPQTGPMCYMRMGPKTLHTG